MIWLLLGLVLFLGAHSVGIVAGPWRARAIARLGEPAWMASAGLIALLGLWMIVLGYGEARSAPDPILLYQGPVWLRHVALLVMLPVFPLLFAAYLPGRIQSVARHPMLAAVKFWALAHLLANGSLADVLLFGSFLAWAVADRMSLKRRATQPVPGAPPGPYNDWIALGLGLGLYLAFILGLHRWLIGVSPLG